MTCNVHPKHKRRSHRGKNDFNRMLNHFLNDAFNDVATKHAVVQKKPAANVIETADSFLIDLAIPGLSKKDIEINVEKDVLKISAKKEATSKEGETVKRTEFNYHEFQRAFRLSEKADLTNIKASFKNGVLTVTISKREEAKDMPPRQIDIQ